MWKPFADFTQLNHVGSAGKYLPPAFVRLLKADQVRAPTLPSGFMGGCH